MAIAAATTWEIRTTGSDTNGGGYSSGGTDYSQQDAAQWSFTDGVTNGSTTITTPTGGITSGCIGNVVYVQGGTGAVTAGWYQIVSLTNDGAFVVDRSTGLTAGTGVTLKIGGALASPGMACGASGGASGGTAVAGNRFYLKSGTYTITSTSNNVSGGRFTLNGGSAGTPSAMYGYQTTRGDGGTKPVVVADSVITTFTLCTCVFMSHVENIEFNGNSRTASTGISAASTSSQVYACSFKNFTTAGISGICFANLCYATTNSGTAFLSCMASHCVAVANTATPFSATTGVVKNCIAYGNTGALTDGFIFTSNMSPAAGNISVSNGRDGFRFSSVQTALLNCIAYGNTGSGFNSVTAMRDKLLYNCAAGGNGTNFNANLPAETQVSCVTLTADPFVSIAGLNFALNNTAGGGALLRALGFPATFPGISTSNYADIGAAQHQEAASGGNPQLVNGGLVKSA